MKVEEITYIIDNYIDFVNKVCTLMDKQLYNKLVFDDTIKNMFLHLDYWLKLLNETSQNDLLISDYTLKICLFKHFIYKRYNM